MSNQSFNKFTPILIIGFGSIGQRHYENLLALGYRNVYVFDTDAKKIPNSKFQIPNKFQITNIKIPNLRNFKVAMVCSPNHFHIKHATLAAEAGCDLFIEKPLSHNLRGIPELIKLCRRKKLVNMAACNMRFHPCLKFIKNYLNDRKLGCVYSIMHEFGHYLPYWRKGVDYRKIYAAKKNEGGGIILDDVHEFDLLFWLNDFPKVKRASWLTKKISKLEIETEDLAVAVFEFVNGTIGLVKSDYLQQRYYRICEIVGERGTLRWDYNENNVWLENKQGRKKLFQAKNYDLNQFYLDQMKYFLNCVQQRRPTFNEVNRAAIILKYVIPAPVPRLREGRLHRVTPVFTRVNCSGNPGLPSAVIGGLDPSA